MAQGEFTKEEAEETRKTFAEVYSALTKNKQVHFIGHANDIYLFLAAAQEAAPEQDSQPGD